MTTKHTSDLLSGEPLDDSREISLHDICRSCQLPAEIVIKYVEYGVIEPSTQRQTTLYFEARCIKRLRSAQRLESDLGVNRAGVALALDLIDELNELRARLKHYEKE